MCFCRLYFCLFTYGSIKLISVTLFTTSLKVRQIDIWLEFLNFRIEEWSNSSLIKNYSLENQELRKSIWIEIKDCMKLVFQWNDGIKVLGFGRGRFQGGRNQCSSWQGSPSLLFEFSLFNPISQQLCPIDELSETAPWVHFRDDKMKRIHPKYV